MITKTTKPEKLIDWEGEFDKKLRWFANGEGSPDDLKSFLHSKLLAQQEKTEKAVLERVRKMLPKKRIMINPVPDSDELIGWNSCVEDLLSKLSEMEEHE